MQYFWFRHTFVLGSEEVAGLRGAVQAALRDTKLEVQVCLSPTLLHSPACCA